MVAIELVHVHQSAPKSKQHCIKGSTRVLGPSSRMARFAAKWALAILALHIERAMAAVARLPTSIGKLSHPVLLTERSSEVAQADRVQVERTRASERKSGFGHSHSKVKPANLGFLLVQQIHWHSISYLLSSTGNPCQFARVCRFRGLLTGACSAVHSIFSSSQPEAKPVPTARRPWDKPVLHSQCFHAPVQETKVPFPCSPFQAWPFWAPRMGRNPPPKRSDPNGGLAAPLCPTSDSTELRVAPKVQRIAVQLKQTEGNRKPHNKWVCLLLRVPNFVWFQRETKRKTVPVCAT